MNKLNKVKLKYEIFLQWNTKFSLQKVLDLPSFGSCPTCMSSANVVAEIQFKLLNENALSTGEPCTCKYVTLLQSFDRLSIHDWYIAQNFYSTFRRSSKTAMFSKFLKVVIYISIAILAIWLFISCHIFFCVSFYK